MQKNSYDLDTQLLTASRDESGQKHPFINYSNKTSGEVYFSDRESEKARNHPMETNYLFEVELLEIQEHARKRAESLSTQTDRSSLIEQTTLQAIKKSVDPIKLTWHDINYTV